MTRGVYLAGPDVFHPDHGRIFTERRATCRRHGLAPLTPLDSGATAAEDIYRASVRLLDGCAAVVANVTPFRGPHCDPGTAWEIGYAVARSVPVFAFSQATAPLRARVGTAGGRFDATGMLVEDFGLIENLMIVMSAAGQVVHPSFEAAVTAAARHLGVKEA